MLQHKGSIHPVTLEENILEGDNFQFVYEGEAMTLPTKILEVEDYSTIFNRENIDKLFTEEEKNELKGLAPSRSMEGVYYGVEGQNIHETHLSNFERKMKCGYFSVLR